MLEKFTGSKITSHTDMRVKYLCRLFQISIRKKELLKTRNSTRVIIIFAMECFQMVLEECNMLESVELGFLKLIGKVGNQKDTLDGFGTTVKSTEV
jgi:hypothetical protein